MVIVRARLVEQHHVLPYYDPVLYKNFRVQLKNGRPVSYFRGADPPQPSASH